MGSQRSYRLTVLFSEHVRHLSQMLTLSPFTSWRLLLHDVSPLDSLGKSPFYFEFIGHGCSQSNLRKSTHAQGEATDEGAHQTYKYTAIWSDARVGRKEDAHLIQLIIHMSWENTTTHHQVTVLTGTGVFWHTQVPTRDRALGARKMVKPKVHHNIHHSCPALKTSTLTGAYTLWAE